MNPDPIQRLILELARLPGVGERTAARLAFYLVKSAQGDGPSLARDLAHALLGVVDGIRFCDRCQNFSADDLCAICRDERRDRNLVCVVEGVSDLRAIEGSGAFKGQYHVLHGALAPLDGVGPEDLKLDDFVRRVDGENCQEVILATNANVEGDATALYLARLLKATGARITRLASGVPLGGELEYLDHATVGRALLERREL